MGPSPRAWLGREFRAVVRGSDHSKETAYHLFLFREAKFCDKLV